VSDKRLTTLRPSGWLFMTDGGSGAVTEWETAQCRHCGGHFPITPGSGRVRGYCTNCRGPVCGPQCAACVPTEQLLENLEAGRDPGFRAVKASAGGIALPPGVEG
jgi:hypothetical protein